jgi:ABC-2 type transport system permease protein
VTNTWWPIVFAVAVAAGMAAVAVRLSTRRDVGAGLRAERTGAATASPVLGTPAGFA